MKNFPRNDVTYYDTFDAFMDGIEKAFGDKTAVSLVFKEPDGRKQERPGACRRGRPAERGHLRPRACGQKISR